MNILDYHESSIELTYVVIQSLQKFLTQKTFGVLFVQTLEMFLFVMMIFLIPALFYLILKSKKFTYQIFIYSFLSVAVATGSLILIHNFRYIFYSPVYYGDAVKEIIDSPNIDYSQCVLNYTEYKLVEEEIPYFYMKKKAKAILHQAKLPAEEVKVKNCGNINIS